jgi:hypothetical protein
MKSRFAILALLLVFGLGLAAVAVFVVGAGEDGDGPVVVGPDGSSGSGEAAVAPEPSERANGRSVAANPLGEQDVPVGLTPDEAGPELTDSADETLGPDEALLDVELRALETDRPLAGVTLVLVPQDERELPNVRTFASFARLGQSPRTGQNGRARFIVPAGRALLLRASPTRNDLRFYGRVTAGDTGEPVEGARVLVRHEDMSRVRDRNDDHLETLLTTETGREGAFDVQVPSWRQLHLRIEADGFAPAIVSLAEGSDTPDDALPIPLQRASALTVRVTDGEGQGLGGLTVQLRTQQRFLMQQEASLANAASAEANWTGTTAMGGRTTFEGLPPDAELYLEIREEGQLVRQEPTSIRLAPGERGQRELVVSRDLSVRGKLTDRRGYPAARQELWMLRARSEGETYIRRYDKAVAKTVTDSQGNFTFPDVAAGLWTIGPSPAYPPNVPRKERFAPIGIAVNVRPNANGANGAHGSSGAPGANGETGGREYALEADRGLYIGGHVKDPEGEVLPEVQVTCSSLTGDYTLMARTDAQGHFEFGPLSRDGYKLVAEPVSAAVSARVEADGGTEDVVIVVGAGGIVRGTVIDTSGKLVAAELTIESTDDPEDPRLQKTTTENGDFRFQNNAPGKYAIVARTSDGRIGVARGLVIEEGKALGAVRVEVEAGATVTVRWEGKPVPWMCTAELDQILVSFAMSAEGGSADLIVPAGNLKIGYASEALNRWGETFVQVGVGETREVVFP